MSAGHAYGGQQVARLGEETDPTLLDGELDRNLGSRRSRLGQADDIRATMAAEKAPARQKAPSEKDPKAGGGQPPETSQAAAGPEKPDSKGGPSPSGPSPATADGAGAADKAPEGGSVPNGEQAPQDARQSMDGGAPEAAEGPAQDASGPDGAGGDAAVGAAQGDAAQGDAAQTDAAQTDAAQTDAAQTDAAQTDAAQTNAAGAPGAAPDAAAAAPAQQAGPDGAAPSTAGAAPAPVSGPAPAAGGGGGAPSTGGGPDPESVGPQIDESTCTDEEPAADAQPGGAGVAGGEPAEAASAAGAEGEASAGDSATEGPSDAELETDEPVDIGAELASMGEGVPAGESVVGGGGGGAAISETPEKQAPDLASSTPEAGIGQLGGLRPDRMLAALGGVGQAVTRESGEARAAAAADAPTMDMQAGDATPAPAPADAQAVEAAAPAPEGADTPAPTPEPTPEPAGRPAAEGAAAPAVTGDAEGKLSDGDAKKMAASIAKMPTRDGGQTTSAGPAPTVPAEGNADPQTVQAQRKSVEKSLGDAEAAARKDAAVKMGEDRISHDRQKRTLTAQLTPSAPGQAPVIEAQAGEMMEAAGVVAQADSGGEIDAALAKAQGDMAAERTRHEKAQQEARDSSAKEIETLKAQNATEQAKEKANAQKEVDGLRTDWQSEADKQTADARKKADAEVESGLKTVADEKKKGEDAAQKAIDDGEKKAGEEQAKGEAEAEKQKKEGEKESSGIFGWLASKAKSFFSKIKKAITAAIDAARKAVKAAIDAAKKLASAAIELARKAIVAAIQIVGKALIAISDTLLAAFPALKEKFRNAIQSRVDQATQAVNALAEKLDKGIQAALDLLGKGLDAALGLLEKGLHMVVDGLNAVVQGAIKAAEGFVNGMLAFMAIIKDVAASPGQWISNLGKAVVDGIKNHLWGAFKTAVKEWFQSKVLEVIGIGGMVVKLLADNGFDLGKIAGFAWEGLKAAIPAALIQILVEKLVSMIVPAAGAVKAIIEGLQAAWGTVSRIIAAVSTFVDFLKAVKSGNAGPQFAQALAAAGVVLIDFVANWLLRKLRKAGKKIGKKLKGLFKKKGKGKSKKGKDKKKDKDEKKKKDKERLDKAVKAIKPKLKKATTAGISKRRLNLKLRLWRVRYRLTSLKLLDSGQVEAKINPSKNVGSVAKIAPRQLGALIEPILAKAEARILKDRAQNRTRGQQARMDSAQQAIEGGGKVDLAHYSDDEQIELLRKIQSGELAIDESKRGSMKGVASLKFGGGGTMYVNNPEDLGQVYVTGAGAYEGSIPKHLENLAQQHGSEGNILANLSKSRKTLLNVEAARMEGGLLTKKMSESMVQSGYAKAGEVVHGDLAPMAFKGAMSGDGDATKTRQLRIGNLTQRLVSAANSVDLRQAPGGKALRKLSKAIEGFVAKHLNGGVEDSDVERLVSAFARFMKTYEGK